MKLTTRPVPSGQRPGSASQPPAPTSPAVAAKEIPGPAEACVTRFEVARLLRVSVRTVDRMIAAGELPRRRVRDKTVRFLRADVERYLNGANDATPQAVPSPPAPLPADGRGGRRTLPGLGGAESKPTRRAA